MSTSFRHVRIQCVPNSTMSQPNTYTSKRTRVFLPIVKTDRREELASVDTTQEPYNSCKSVPATHLSVKNSSRWPSSPPPPAGAPANLPGTWWRYRTTGNHQHQTTSSEYRARPTSWLAGNRTHTSSISKVDQLACERTCRVRIDALEQCRLNKLLVAMQQIAHHLVREHSRPRQRGPLAKPLEPCTAVVVLRPRSERWFYG